MTIQLDQLIVWLIIGAAAGALAGLLIRGRRQGPLLDVVVGLAGALVGGVLFNVLNIQINLGQLVFTGRDFVAALIGAILLLVGLRLIRR